MSTGPVSAERVGTEPAGGGTGGFAAGPAATTAAEGRSAGSPVAAALIATRAVLVEGGAPEALAEPVVSALGERAAELLREDPWQVLALPAVRVGEADALARALLGPGCGPGDPRRARALVVRALERAAVQGHTALEASAVRADLDAHRVPDADEALREAVTDGQVLVFQENDPDVPGGGRGGSEAEEEPPVRVLLGLDRYALAEESLADGLVRLLSTLDPHSGPAPVRGTGPADRAADATPEASASPDADASTDTDAFSNADTPSDADGAETAGTAEAADDPQGPHGRGRAVDWASAADAASSPSASELVRAVAGSGLTLHTGGEAARAEPAALVALARSMGLRAWAAALTEDSAQRLRGLVGSAEGRHEGGPVLTVAELLAQGGVGRSGRYGQDRPGRSEDGRLALDLLVVCDAPQLDVELAATVVESLPDGARLVLSGDPNMLWSVGPGRVFADLLAARVCPVVASRTPDPGPVGELVSGIGIGELTAVEAPGKEVVVVPVREAAEAVHRTVQLVADSIPRAIGVSPRDTVVITPGHGGAAGTRALNAALKARLNPGPGRFGGFDPGDRVVHVPAPGTARPAVVVSAEEDGLRLEGADGERFTVPRGRIAEVRHGWAITAHQAVGLRRPAVVAVLPGDAAQALSRQWVYTAFGRAERHLSVVQGVDQALTHCVAELPAVPRTSRLRSILAEQQA